MAVRRQMRWLLAVRLMFLVSVCFLLSAFFGGRVALAKPVVLLNAMGDTVAVVASNCEAVVLGRRTDDVTLVQLARLDSLRYLAVGYQTSRSALMYESDGEARMYETDAMQLSSCGTYGMISNKGLVAIARLPRLTTLWLSWRSSYLDTSALVGASHKQRTVAAAVQDSIGGRDLSLLGSLRSLRRLRLTTSRLERKFGIHERDLKWLSSLVDLRELALEGMYLPTGTGAAVAGLPSLVSLAVLSTQSQEGDLLSRIVNAKSLRRLILVDASDSGAAQIRQLSSVTVRSKRPDVEQWRDHPNLRSLECDGMALAEVYKDSSRGALEWIREMPMLDTLVIKWSASEYVGIALRASSDACERMSRLKSVAVKGYGSVLGLPWINALSCRLAIEADGDSATLAMLGRCRSLDVIGVRMKTDASRLSAFRSFCGATSAANVSVSCSNEYKAQPIDGRDVAYVAASLARLRNCRELTLSFEGAESTSGIADMLRALPGLRRVDLRGCPIDDGVVDAISESKAIEEVALPRIDDYALVVLKDVATLKRIECGIDMGAPGRWADFRDALPNCRIGH